MKLSQAAAQTLQQAELYLPYLTTGQYTARPPLLQGSSIGQHTRHFIEFFECLLSQCQQPEAEINYSKRKRSAAVESSPDQALQRIQSLCQQLKGIKKQRLLVLQCQDLQNTTASSTVPTNLERELVYNIEHTIHHLALIKIALALVAPQLEVPDAFGTAPSTISFRAAR